MMIIPLFIGLKNHPRLCRILSINSSLLLGKNHLLAWKDVQKKNPVLLATKKTQWNAEADVFLQKKPPLKSIKTRDIRSLQIIKAQQKSLKPPTSSRMFQYVPAIGWIPILPQGSARWLPFFSGIPTWALGSHDVGPGEHGDGLGHGFPLKWLLRDHDLGKLLWLRPKSTGFFLGGGFPYSLTITTI